MKILLQHTQTLLYLRSSDTWTKNEFEAQDFRHSRTAIDFALQYNLQDLQIAVKFWDPEEDVVVPLSLVANRVSQQTAL